MYLTYDATVPTILAVDDRHIAQQEIKYLLANCCNVKVSNNTGEALNLIYNRKISLMLVNSSMSQPDGIELCRTVRSISQFRELPIIMLTPSDNFVNKVKCKLAGATDYITTPYAPTTLKQIVSKYLSMNTSDNTKSQVYQL